MFSIASCCASLWTHLKHNSLLVNNHAFVVLKWGHGWGNDEEWPLNGTKQDLAGGHSSPYQSGLCKVFKYEPRLFVYLSPTHTLSLGDLFLIRGGTFACRWGPHKRPDSESTTGGNGLTVCVPYLVGCTVKTERGNQNQSMLSSKST